MEKQSSRLMTTSFTVGCDFSRRPRPFCSIPLYVSGQLKEWLINSLMPAPPSTRRCIKVVNAP